MAPQAQPLRPIFPTCQRAILPRNSDGDYFDEIVDEHDGAQFVYGAVAWLALQLLAHGLAGISLDEA